MLLCGSCAELRKGDCTYDEDPTKKDESDSVSDKETCANEGQPSSNDAPDEAPEELSAAEEADYAGAESEASGSKAPSTNRPKSALIMDIARRHRRYVLAAEGHHKKIKEALLMKRGGPAQGQERKNPGGCRVVST